MIINHWGTNQDWVTKAKAQVWYTKSISRRTEYFGVKLESLIFTLQCILPSLILYAQNKPRRILLAAG